MLSVGRTDGRFVRTGTVVPSMRLGSQNIQRRESNSTLPRTGITLPPVSAASRRNIPSAAESGESFAHGITDPQAAVAVALHPSCLLLGEEGIRYEAVAVKDRVIESLHAVHLTPNPKNRGVSA